MKIAEAQVEQLLDVFHEADEAVLEVYERADIAFELKEDESPITAADIAAHHILMDGIGRIFPGIPIVSEEGDQDLNRQAVMEDAFWLVDPIDGTREFLDRTGDFTVCAGLIEDNKPIFGVISAPAKSVIYYGGVATNGSFRKDDTGVKALQPRLNLPGRITASRTSHSPKTQEYVDAYLGDFDSIVIGSQLKFPYIAEGEADIYPRHESPLHLWDLAAGQAILEGAGGVVSRFDSTTINYREPTLKAGDFIATSGLIDMRGNVIK